MLTPSISTLDSGPCQEKLGLTESLSRKTRILSLPVTMMHQHHYWTVILLATLLCLHACLSAGRSVEEERKHGYIAANVSQEGLDFAKEVLVRQAVKALTPLHLPMISKSVRIPFLGGVQMTLSNITLSYVNVSSSRIYPGDTGIVIVANGATANITMDWRYSYSSWIFPIDVSDKGSAAVRVEGMQTGITLRMENHYGVLRLILDDCGCVIRDIFISLGGGASWFYQGLVDAFEEQIRSTVETAVMKKIRDGILKIDLMLENLPSEVTIDNIASLNITFIDDPVVQNGTLGLKIDGSFTSSNISESSSHSFEHLQPKVLCDDLQKMLAICVDENVLNSASVVYFKAGILSWLVDKIPDQSLLNTAGWRFIIPQLYKKYPNDPMKLNVTVTAPPITRITPDGVSSSISADMTIVVIESGEMIPVACISMVVTASGTLEMSETNLAGAAQLDGFSLALKWSNIGNFHMYLIQTVVRVLLRDAFVPYVNLHLRRGFPLPTIHGFKLENPEVSYSDSSAVICTDVASVGSNWTDIRAISKWIQ